MDIDRLKVVRTNITKELSSDMNTAGAVSYLQQFVKESGNQFVTTHDYDAFTAFLQHIDSLLGLNLCSSQDITDDQKNDLDKRTEALRAKNYVAADALRDSLLHEGIELLDLPNNNYLWRRA